MAFPEQIDKLVWKLTELTDKDKVDWQETANVNTFLAPVGQFVGTVSRGGSEVYGGYSFQILDKAGRTIDGALATFSVPERGSSAALQNWERLRNLHKLARRRALQADQAVSELLTSLEEIH